MESSIRVEQTGQSPLQRAWRHAFICLGMIGQDRRMIDTKSDYDKEMRNRGAEPDTKSISNS